MRNSILRAVVFILSFWAFIALACYLNSAHAQEAPIPKGPYYLLRWKLDAATGETVGDPGIEKGPFESVDDCRAAQVGQPAEKPVAGRVFVHECGISHIDVAS